MLARAESREKQSPQQVLIVHSAYQGYPWTESLTKGILETFNSSSVEVDLQFEYLDTKRNRDEYYFEKLRKLWKIKFQNRRIDLVLVCDNQAYDFVLQERNGLFIDIPIVFAAYIGYSQEMLTGMQPITGGIQKTDIAATIDIALSLHPQTKKVVFVAPGAPPFRMVWLEGLEERYAEKVELVNITAEKIPQIDKELESFEEPIVVIPLNSALESDGTYFPFDQFVSYLSIERSFPVYALWDIALGTGVVGGKMVTGTSQGRKAATLALKILQGTPTNEVAVDTNSPNQYMFDWNIMEHFKIKSTDLPQESIVINRPESFYQEHTNIVRISVAVIFILVTLIFSLIIAVLYLRKTQRKLLISTKIIKENESRFKKMIQKSPLPMVVTDQNQDILLFNDKFTELFGYTIADIRTAEDWWNNVYPDLRYRKKVQDGWITAIDKAQKAGTDIEMQNWDITTKDGTQRECEFYTVPLQHMSLIIMNDISERRESELLLKKYSENLESMVQKRTDELRNAQKELLLQEKLAAIGKLSGSVAHDIRNPLGVISNSIYFLDHKYKESPEELLKKHVRIMSNEIEKANDIITDLLDFSREIKAVLVESSINDVVKGVLNTFIFPKESIVKTNLSAEIPPFHFDSSMLNRILHNLVNNAVQAMPEGGLVMISTDRTSDSVILKVIDNGEGITAENTSKIFEPLFTTKAKGVGLGLSIVKTFIEKQGGKIEVESIVGKGSTFSITLPLNIKNK